MVKDGEPASVYFEQSVLRSEALSPLQQLGIVKIEDPKPYTYRDSTGAVNGLFARFGQGQIPDINKLTQSYDPKTGDAIKQPGSQPQILFQPLRPDKGARAETLMGIQLNVIDSLLTSANALLKNSNIVSQVAVDTDTLLNDYKNKTNTDEGIAISSLGYDTILDILTLNSIAHRLIKSGENSNLTRDELNSLDVVINDLQYRRMQVEAEKNMAVFIPQLPTGCDLSANFRGILADNAHNISASIETEDREKNFASILHWNFHFATQIDSAKTIIGPGDRLFIEDAVGKSASEFELANAHWVAHIYGHSESVPTDVQEDKDGECIELDCKFNKLSKELRCRFFKDIDEKSQFNICYWEYEDPNHPTGISQQLEVVVQGSKLKYKFSPQSDKGPQLAPHMKHFMLDMLKTITDEFVLMAVSGKKMSEMKDFLNYLSNIARKRTAIENIDIKQSMTKYIEKKKRLDAEFFGEGEEEEEELLGEDEEKENS